MKRAKQIRSNIKKGFSILDLLVTISILSILVSIAIPNLTKFQVKSRETEAKTALGAILTAERIYFQEQGGSSNNLVRIGFTPDGKVLFNCGFENGVEIKSPNDSAGLTYFPNTIGTAPAYCGVFATNCQFDVTFGGVPSVVISSGLPYTAAPTSFIFFAACVGDIGGANHVIWEIDQTGLLFNRGPAF